MQNWDGLQPTANYDQHNNWYNSMFAANIKTEPDSSSPTLPAANTPPGMTSSHLEQYLKQHHHYQQQQQQQQQQPMDTMSAMTPSPGNNDSMQHFFDNNLQQQQLYQQQFQQAQQAAAHNQITSAHLPLGFNPLTPPGLPTAVLPSISHFYNNNNNNNNINNNNNVRTNNNAQTLSPQPTNTNTTGTGLQSLLTDSMQFTESKLQAALTPRNTPPMDVTPPKSPKQITTTIAVAAAATTTTNIPTTLVVEQQQQQQLLAKVEKVNNEILLAEKEQDLLSNSSEDMKYMVESEDDETIRMPIYNSHGKMKNYKCKSCGMVAITKVAFWQHARSHMKPEKLLQCPKCPFVTELKHHLEYHIRKHKNLKPFQCDKCSYTCVNKSMLNSHRKSHSSVYQYRCADCDYATKYCHSFKLHLRKYEHKPGLVLDEEGLPNPSVVIDVYGTRRGPKNKSGNIMSGNKRHNERHSDVKLSTSQLSAALQGFPAAHQLPASPAKSSCSTASELPQKSPAGKLNNNNNQATTMPNLLPPLATIFQQNRNMAFFPYWNLNLQMLAAQQQAAVLAQLSPRMRETALQQLQWNNDDNESTHEHDTDANDDDENENDDDVEKSFTEIQDAEHFDRKSIDSAMDLSQGTPTKDEQQKLQQQQQHIQLIPDLAMNLKLNEEEHETPILTSTGAARRKGRVLKLETKSASQSPEQCKNDEIIMPTASSPLTSGIKGKIEEPNSSVDESMEITANNVSTTQLVSNTAAANTSSSSNTSAASSSGNSSNSSNTSNTSNSNSNSSTLNASSPAAAGAIYECKYCDIFFKDAVLYTIHMGYHSCDDVFKCNMCGEKCDGPVGLFVHMARNAHS